MIQLKPITTAEWPAVRRLYTEAFPQRERKPLWMMRLAQRRGRAELLVLSDGGVRGLAFTLLHEDLVLIDYLAVDAACRGSGLGSEALRLIAQRYAGRRLVLEIERPDAAAPNNAQRVHRKAFYEKNGWRENEIYVTLNGIPMELLVSGEPVNYPEYERLYHHSVGRVIAARIRETNP